MATRVDAAVIGAGISGLACAHRLRSSGLDVVILERDGRAGGVIHSDAVDGCLLEYGPNSTLDSKPALGELIAELDLSGEVVYASDIAKYRYVVRDGELVALPTAPPGLLTTKLFSTGAKLRVLSEMFRPGRRHGEEETVAAFFERRFGKEVVDYAVNPFVAGVYAGDAAKLSARSAFPAVVAMEREHGSVLRGAVKAAKAKRAAGGSPTRMLSFRVGMETLVERLAGSFGEALRLGNEVVSIAPGDDGWRIAARADDGGEELTAGAVVLSLPAPGAAEIVGPFDADASQALSEIHYAPIAIVHLAYPREEVRHPLDGFGFLVPEVENRRILGAIFNSSLFPRRAPDGHVLLTVFAGGERNPTMLNLDDAALSDAVRAELHDLLGAGEPATQRITRIVHAIPQYRIGHHRVDDAMASMKSRFPGIHVCANYAGGVSVADCVASAFAEAESVVRFSRNRGTGVSA